MGDNFAKLYEKFQQEFLEDTQIPSKVGEQLYDTYYLANEQERKIIDDIFTNICGWRFYTLLEMADINVPHVISTKRE